MISALGSHRFNPQTGLWELVTLENTAGVEMSLPAVAEVGGVGADGPGTALPEPVTPSPLDDFGNAPPVELEKPDVFVATETIIICDPVVPALVEPEPLDVVFSFRPSWWLPPIAPTVIERPDGLTIIGGPIHSVLEGGDGNDLIIAGASADHPSNQDPYAPYLFSDRLGNPLYRLDGSDPEFIEGPFQVGEVSFRGVYVFGDDLLGGLGQDTLIGNDRRNFLDGGAGADVMIGGGGRDIYVVNNAGDRVIEYNHGGIDVVRASINYILPDNVEGLFLEGTSDLNGAGNALNNLLVGNEGNNILSGGAGDDRLSGGGGDDTLIGGEGRDVFIFLNGRFDFLAPLEGVSVIADFQVGVDKISGVAWTNSFFGHIQPGLVLPDMHQDGADTVITLRHGEIRLIGVDVRLIGVQDFLPDLGLPPLFY